MEEQVQEFIQAYEKEYQKAKNMQKFVWVLYILYVVGAFWCIVTQKSITVISVVFLIAVTILALKRNQAMTENGKKIVDKWTEDYDTEFAVSAYQELLKNKKRKDYRLLLGSYLNLLLILCRFEEFEKVYQENADVMKKRMTSYLVYFQECFAALLPDRTYLKSLLAKHKYSKYHNVQGELKGIKAALRMQDENYEVLRLYENQEYQKAIEKIDLMHLDSGYNRMVFDMMKERCLYRICEEHHLPELKNPEFLCVKRLKHLVETGEELTYERADVMLKQIESDVKICQKSAKKRRLFLLLFLLVVFGMLFYSDMDKNKKGEDGFVSDLEIWDIEASEVYGFCENDDISVGVMWGKMTESDRVPAYYLVGIDYFTDGIIPKMKVGYEVIGFYMDEAKIYTYTGEDSTYVVMTLEEDTRILYDGKIVSQNYDTLPVLGTEAQSIVSFIVDGEFEVDKIEIVGENEVELI